MQLSLTKAAFVFWGIFFAYWFIAAPRSASAITQREPLPSRLLFLLILGLAVSLIVFDPLVYGPLLWRFLPQALAIELVGLVILLAGLAFAVWARIHLGRYWSARVTLSEQHQLIQTGPYRLVRNPIYFGGLVAVVGTAIVVGQLRALLAIPLVLVAFMRKIHLEERWLAARFGGAYDDYRRHVKALIPYLY